MSAHSNNNLLDQPFVVAATGVIKTKDTFQNYAKGINLNGLRGGSGWRGPYVARNNLFGVYWFDTFESYADATPLTGLDDFTWNGPYLDRNNFVGLLASEDFESYDDATDLIGLNGGSGWNGAYAHV